jgi:hypothetical protein
MYFVLSPMRGSYVTEFVVVNFTGRDLTASRCRKRALVSLSRAHQARLLAAHVAKAYERYRSGAATSHRKLSQRLQRYQGCNEISEDQNVVVNEPRWQSPVG